MIEKRVVQTPEQMWEIVGEVMGSKDFVTIDCETTGTDWVHDELVGVSILVWGEDHGWYIPWHDKHRFPTLTKPQITELFKAIFSFKDVVWVNQNIKFDLHFFQRFFDCVPKGRCICTLVAQSLIWECGANGLKDLIFTYAGIVSPDWNDLNKLCLKEMRDVIREERKVLADKYYAGGPKQGGIRRDVADARALHELNLPDKCDSSNWPLERLAFYAIDDVYYAGLLWTDQRVWLKDEGQEDNFNVEVDLTSCLFNIETAGVPIDVPLAVELRERIREDFVVVDTRIKEQVVKPNSGPQLQKIIYENMGFKCTRRTKTNQPSVDRETIQYLLGEFGHNQFLIDLMDWRQYTKLDGTYLSPMIELSVDSKLHCTLNQGFTVTGRLSCSAPNLQNVPIRTEIGRQLRKLFLAPKGMVIIKADASQAELRLLAHESQDPILLKTYRENGDIHRETALAITDGDESNLKHIRDVVAKPVNFGMIYGIGPYKLRFKLVYEGGMTVSLAETKGFIEKTYNKYSYIRPYQAELLSFARRHGYVENLYGRRRHLEYITSRDAGLRSSAERMAKNFPMQSGVGGIVSRWMNILDKELPTYGAFMILQIHDELLTLCPEDTAEECAVFIKEVGENIVNLSIPWVCDVSIGERWGM